MDRKEKEKMNRFSRNLILRTDSLLQTPPRRKGKRENNIRGEEELPRKRKRNQGNPC